MTDARAREALRRTLAKASERDRHVDVDPAVLDRLEDAIRRIRPAAGEVTGVRRVALTQPGSLPDWLAAG